MTSLMDEDEGLERLAGALHEIDAKVAEDVSNGNKILNNPTSDEKYHSFIEKIYQKYPREMQIYQAEELPYKEVTLEDVCGHDLSVSAGDSDDRSGRDYHEASGR